MPNGRELVTLHDAGTYITKLPKPEHDAPRWQAAMQALLLVVENDGDPMLARIGMMRALHPDESVPTPRKKKAKTYRIVRGKK